MTPIAFQDLAEGACFRSTGRTLSDSDLTLACMITGDWHPLHADAEYAKTSGLGRRALHGPYGILLAMGMSTRLPEFADKVIGATGIRDWRYRLPLFPGETVHVEATITTRRVTSDGRRAIVERTLKLIDQEGRTVQEGIVGTMLLLQGASAS
jgi:acyl dehydratase